MRSLSSSTNWNPTLPGLLSAGQRRSGTRRQSANSPHAPRRGAVRVRRVVDTTAAAPLAGLGLSLKPPKWARNLVKSALSQTKVSVPTPAGEYVVDLSDPTSIAQAKQMITGAKIQVGQTQSGAGQQALNVANAANDFVSQIPGGWVTVIGVPAGLLLLPQILKALR